MKQDKNRGKQHPTATADRVNSAGDHEQLKQIGDKGADTAETHGMYCRVKEFK